MGKRLRLRNRKPKSLEEIYFSNIRSILYERSANLYQYGIITGKTLAEHLDSACQFILTVTKIAGVSEQKRRVILATIRSVVKYDWRYSRTKNSKSQRSISGFYPS